MTILRKRYVPSLGLPGRTRVRNCTNESLQKNVVPTNNIRFHSQLHDDRYELLLALPGYGRDDVKIELANSILNIEVQDRTEGENSKTSWKEIEYAGRRAQFYFPEDADPENIQATMKNGLLKITLHKVAEAIPHPPKAITVK